jgi:hypothetical protein
MLTPARFKSGNKVFTMADRSADEVQRLRFEARESATVCADCFAPLAPMASITMRWRLVQHVPEQTFGAYAPELRDGADLPPLLAGRPRETRRGRAALELDHERGAALPLRGVPPTDAG